MFLVLFERLMNEAINKIVSFNSMHEFSSYKFVISDGIFFDIFG